MPNEKCEKIIFIIWPASNVILTAQNPLQKHPPSFNDLEKQRLLK